jgi:hypothetical protein
MYQRLLELIKLIFGKNAINKTIGTRTNVIQLPNNKTKRYIKEDLNIEAASDAAAMNAKKEMEELIAEIPKMNDAERLIFEGNLQRLKNRLGLRSETDPTAEVFDLGTKEKVTPGGITSLTEKAGQKSPPGTLMGNIESRIKQLEASGEDLSTMKGQTLDEIMGDVMQTQKTMSKMQDEGLVRAAVRYKMMDDLKRGTLKLPKNLEDVVRGASNEEEVITIFRNNYGEDALEQVDSLIPDFYKMTSPADAVKKIEKNFPNMKPKKIEVKQTMDLDEAKKAEQENILTPGKAIPADSPEGKKITEALIGKPKAEVVSLPTAEKILSDMRNLGPIDAMKEANKVLKKEGPYKNLTDKDIEKIMDDINDHIFGGDLPVDPEDFANGGRVGFNEGSKLTDYIKTNISASTSSSSPEEGVKVKQEILDGIISLNIPLSKKLKLLGDLKFGKNRAKVDLSELGKKYGIDLGEEVYKDKYFSPGLGAEYTTDEGTKFNLMVNPEDKGGSISVSRSFANGGSTGLDYLMGVDRKGYADGSNYEFIKTLPKSLSDAINKFGFDAVIGKTVESGGGNAPGEYIPGKYTPYYSLMEADSGGGTGLKDEYLRILEAGPVKSTPKTTPKLTPVEELQTTYTANVTPSTSSAAGLYPNNPFYSPFFGVSTKEDTSKTMSSDISVLYDQYMKNLGYESGGRVGFMDGGSKGLDYLTGMDRNNYQYGGDVYEKYLSYLNDLESMGAPSSNILSSNILYSQPSYTYQQSDGDGTEDTPTPTGVPSTFQPTKMDMFSLAVNPAYGVANIASRTKTGLSLMDRAMDAMGIGRGIGGRTQGYGVDSVNAQSVSDEGTVDANEGFGNQGGDDGPAGPGGAAGGGSDGADANDGFAQGGIVKRTKNADGGLNYLLGF